MEKATERKPTGWGAFSDLAKKLVKVPKDGIERKTDAQKSKPRKKK